MLPKDFSELEAGEKRELPATSVPRRAELEGGRNVHMRELDGAREMDELMGRSGEPAEMDAAGARRSGAEPVADRMRRRS